MFADRFMSFVQERNCSRMGKLVGYEWRTRDGGYQLRRILLRKKLLTMFMRGVQRTRYKGMVYRRDVVARRYVVLGGFFSFGGFFF